MANKIIGKCRKVVKKNPRTFCNGAMKVIAVQNNGKKDEVIFLRCCLCFNKVNLMPNILADVFGTKGGDNE